MKNNYVKLTLLCIILIICTSCKNLDMFLNPDGYIPRDSPIQREIVHDTIRLSNNGGELSEVVTGARVNKQIVFTGIGQSFSFRSGEGVEISADGVDLSTTTFDVESNEKTKEIKLTLVDKDASRILISSENQVVVRTGVDYVPKIELAPGLSMEQIVVTPVVNDNCERIGFEIRYGSKNSSELRKDNVYKRYLKCTKNGSIEVKPAKKGKSDDDPCRLKRKLGIPCNK